MLIVNAVTQQIRIDILNQLDNINHLYHSKLIYENESTVEHLSETIDTYLKAIKTENIAQSDGKKLCPIRELMNAVNCYVLIAINFIIFAFFYLSHVY